MKQAALAVVMWLVLSSSVCGLQTAGTLAVDLDVNDLVASDGDKITSWQNDGSLAGAFTNATAGEGALFRTNIAGAAAVEFSGNVNTVMTSPYGVPPALTSNRSYSVEVWIHNPAISASVENFLAWTPRGDSDDPDTASTYELMELRYYNTAANVVEHYGYNVGWGARGIPPVGEWHHVVATRDMGTSIERVYVDGSLRESIARPLTRIRDDGVFVLGATENANQNGFALYFSGYLGKVRIHTGTLSDAQVVQNYLEERDEYGVTAPADTVWQGAAGVELDWHDPANWVVGNVAEGGSYATIDNGGIPVLTNSLSSPLEGITSSRGGLVVSNSATLSVNGNDHNLGDGVGNTYELTVASGTFEFPGTQNPGLRFGANGATATGLIGVDGAAELAVNKDLYLGVGNGSTGIVTIAAGGSVYTTAGWTYLGLNEGSYGKVIVNGGFFGSTQNTLSVRVGHHGGHAELVVNSGSVACNGDVLLTSGNANSNSDARVYLNGGDIEARRVFAEDTEGIAMIYLNGGTIRNKDSRNNFMHNMDAALVQSGGVTFDIISNTTVTVAQPLIEDSGSAGGGLTKEGEGTLILSGTNTITGDITVGEGFLWLDHTNGLVASYSGTITMNNADAGIGYNRSGGIDELLALMDTNSVGSITVLSNNAADDIDFSMYPGLTLAFGAGVSYTGTYTPYGETITLYPVGAGNTFAQVVTGTSNVEVYGGVDDDITFTGDSSYSGGTLVDGCELVMSHSNALGTGSITLTNSAVLTINAAVSNAAFAQRITADSKGFVMLTSASAGLDLDLSGRPGIRVGTRVNTLTYGGEITPTDGAYRFTGGGQQMRVSGNSGLLLNNLDGTEAVVVENGNGDREFIVNGRTGGVTLNNNSYSGGTVVTNRGLIRLNGDAFSAVPPSVDPDNIYVDDGCIRFSTTTTFHENRGLTVGPGGLELHPWSARTLNINGPLSGTGDIFSTDNGSVFFGGISNTWSGSLRINGSKTLGIGYGDRFSWNNSAPIVGLGGNFALRYDGDLTWASEFDNPLGADGADLRFRKMGSGTLTVDVDPVYTQNTAVEGGTLQYGSLNAIPHDAGKGNLNVGAGASVDVNGYDAAVNGLSGSGSVVDSDGGASTFAAGENDVSSTFSGSIDSSLELRKVGTGTLTLDGSDLRDASVEAGVLALVNPVSITGSVDIADAATLRVTGDGARIVGEFYDYALADQNELNTVAGIDALFAGLTPAAVAPVGPSDDLDFGATGSGFPAPYNQSSRNNFVAKWEGHFIAATNGQYTFFVKSDDGSALVIDGEMVLANGSSQSYEEENRSATVTLSEGCHEFLLAYSEASGAQGLSLFVTPPGGSEIGVPGSMLMGTRLASDLVDVTCAPGGTLEVTEGAAVAMNVDTNSAFDGHLSVADGGALIKRGAATLDIGSQGVTVDGMTYVEEGNLFVDSDTTDSFGAVNIASGAGLAFQITATGTAEPDLAGVGLTGYYYDVTPPGGTNNPKYHPYLDGGVLSNAVDYLMGLPLGAVANSSESTNVFYFGYDSIGAFPVGYENTENFQVLWTGQIVVPVDGEYGFRIDSDDGSMLYINGEIVAAYPGWHSAAGWKSGTVNLTAGAHQIDITFFEATGGDVMGAQILIPGGSWQPLPNQMLRPAMTEIGPLCGDGSLSLDASSGALLIDENRDTAFSGDVAATSTAVIYKSGASRLTLTGDNSGHEGSWSILEGILQVGDGVTAGILGGSTVYVEVGAELLFYCPGNIVYNGTLIGGGTIRSMGGGTVTLTGDRSGFTGVIDVKILEGTLMIVR